MLFIASEFEKCNCNDFVVHLYEIILSN